MTQRLHLDRLKQADRVLWLVIATMAGSVLLAAMLGPFRIEWMTFSKPGLVASLLVLGSWFYATVRKDAALADALTSAAQIIAFAAVAAPVSYISASAAFPLWDSELMVLDRRMGFDWMSWLDAMNAAPLLHRLLALA